MPSSSYNKIHFVIPRNIITVMRETFYKLVTYFGFQYSIFVSVRLTSYASLLVSCQLASSPCFL